MKLNNWATASTTASGSKRPGRGKFKWHSLLQEVRLVGLLPRNAIQSKAEVGR